MNWKARSRAAVIAHEDAYCTGYYKPARARPVKLVGARDLRLEDWLERGGAERLQRDTADREAIRSIYLWKVRANVESEGGVVDFPEDLASPAFAEALRALLVSRSDYELASAVDTLQGLSGIRVRVASAFAYWLRPDDYQLIDVRSTQALDLAFSDDDYTPENYARFCQLSRELAAQHELTLRQIDRVLFAYHRLLCAGHFLE